MKRCVIATDHLRLSAGPTHKTTIPFPSSELRILPLQTGVHSDDQKSTKRHQQRARWRCGDMRGNENTDSYHSGILPRTEKRGQYGSLVQRKPEELLSLTVHTAALSGRCQLTDPWVRKDRSSGLHQLLLTERIEGKRYAPKHTCAFVLLHLGYSQRLEAGVTPGAPSRGVLSLTSWFVNRNVCRWKHLGGRGCVNIKMWAVKVCEIISARLVSERAVLDCSCDQFHVEWIIVICVCLPTCGIVSSSVALLLNVHSSIIGRKLSLGHTPTDPEAFSVVQ